MRRPFFIAEHYALEHLERLESRFLSDRVDVLVNRVADLVVVTEGREIVSGDAELGSFRFEVGFVGENDLNKTRRRSEDALPLSRDCYNFAYGHGSVGVGSRMDHQVANQI